MKCLLKSLGQIQCAKDPQCLSWNQGFFIALIWEAIVPQPTPVFFNRGSAEPQGSPSFGCHGFRRKRPKLPGMKFANTVLRGCSSATVSQSHMVPRATQKFAEGSAAAKRLKNTALHLTLQTKVFPQPQSKSPWTKERGDIRPRTSKH